MRTARSKQTVLALRVTPEVRTIVEQLAAKLTIRLKKRHTLTDVLEKGIRLLAEREGVKVG